MKKFNIEIGFKNLRQFFILVLLFIVLTGFFTFITLIILIHSEDTVKVPDVKGLNIIDAAERLQSLGLNYYVSLKSSNDYPKFTVVSQGIEPDEEVKKDRKIMLLVSSGSEFLDIPDLVNKNIKQIEQIFTSDSKVYIEKVEFVNSVKPVGTIIDQSPKPGSFSSDRIGLRLWVSNGRGQIDLSLNGLYEKEALIKAKQEGFSTLVEYSNVDDPKKDGKVISFEVVKGYINIVKIVVGKLSDKDNKTIIFNIPEELDRKIVRLVCFDNRGKTILFEGRAYPGEDIIETFRPFGNPKIYLYTVENNEEKFYKEITD